MAEEKRKNRMRPSVGVFFKCCKVYSRVYLNKKGKAFVGWCPKCAGRIEMKVSPNGSTSKLFYAD